MNLIDLTEIDKQEVDTTVSSMSRKLQSVLNKVKHSSSEFGLIVDGQTLKLLSESSKNTLIFTNISTCCAAVVCCRLSPLQKSEIVKIMKTSSGRPVTAAIGDGGNDVSMILEAHIGFGIMGREGRAAVRSSDIAFSKF